MDAFALLIVHGTIGKSAGDAAPDHGRRVRHGPHHGGLAEMSFEETDRLAGRDRDDDRVRPDGTLHRRQHRLHHLRLDREEEHACLQIRGKRSQMGRASLADRRKHRRRRAGIDNDDGRARNAAFQPAGEHRPAHVSGTDQNDGMCRGESGRRHLMPRRPFQTARLPSPSSLPYRTRRRTGMPENRLRRYRARWKAAPPPGDW